MPVHTYCNLGGHHGWRKSCLRQFRLSLAGAMRAGVSVALWQRIKAWASWPCQHAVSSTLGGAMLCPKCGRNTRVIKTNLGDENTVNRVRWCERCEITFKTREQHFYSPHEVPPGTKQVKSGRLYHTSLS